MSALTDYIQKVHPNDNYLRPAARQPYWDHSSMPLLAAGDLPSRLAQRRPVGMQAVEDLLTQGIMADATRGRLKSRARWRRRIRDRE
jgi:hypothetical protein